MSDFALRSDDVPPARVLASTLSLHALLQHGPTYLGQPLPQLLIAELNQLIRNAREPVVNITPAAD